MAPRHERALEIARKVAAEAVLAASLPTVAWLTGFAPDIQTGPNPFAMPPLALLTNDGPPLLIISEDDAQAGAALGNDVVSYKGFTSGPLRPIENALQALKQAVGRRRVATEPGSLPAAFAAELGWVDASADLALARAVKDPDEILKLRAAVALCDVGQWEARRGALAGRTELDVWAAVKAAIEREAGGRTPVLVDLLSGSRTDEVGAPPSLRILRKGELLLTDLAPRHNGYWGDSCTTISIGEPNTSVKSRYNAVRETLERATASIKPGVAAGQLDELVRKNLNYLHHTGHGLGTAYHEEPRIVPGSPSVLLPNMVIAIEPGMYGDGAGIRLERVVLVTSNGCEVLSKYDLDL
jgi:Xaa-Pro dipeptidase